VSEDIIIVKKEPTWHRKIRQARNLLLEGLKEEDCPDPDRIRILHEDVTKYLEDNKS